ncbi:hypothetical protein [Burkholderia sp. TSV86]|uniref:hypothetical protein n=1 Tax=Burkholderia sp. TSV86 TaxID=1385594 RepID=UPI00075655A3|nr:hypothetical protein [Burkholderia sp. TSV86]KVE33904.1 phage tail protein [Burkholderia sp. TSV86]
MNTRTVFQTDRAGMYCGTASADESPLEPGVFLMPAGAVDVAPPDKWPDDKWPRWSGAAWELVTRPRPIESNLDPIEKLRAFLAANPDVAIAIEQRPVLPA